MEAVRAPTAVQTFTTARLMLPGRTENGFKWSRVLKTLRVRSDEREVGVTGRLVFFGESQWQQETEDGAVNAHIQRTAPFPWATFLMIFRVPAAVVGAAAVRAVNETQVVVRKEVAL